MRTVAFVAPRHDLASILVASAHPWTLLGAPRAQTRAILAAWTDPDRPTSIDLGASSDPQLPASLDLGASTGSARWPERLDVLGQLEARGPFTCVRCLTRFEMAVERNITHILVRNLDVTDSSDEEVELNRSDLDRSELRGDSVNLTDVLREELLLAMPMKAVCRDDCEGICSGCGVDLNNESCICKPQIDERWAALAALKTDES